MACRYTAFQFALGYFVDHTAQLKQATPCLMLSDAALLIVKRCIIDGCAKDWTSWSLPDTM